MTKRRRDGGVTEYCLSDTIFCATKWSWYAIEKWKSSKVNWFSAFGYVTVTVLWEHWMFSLSLEDYKQSVFKHKVREIFLILSCSEWFFSHCLLETNNQWMTCETWTTSSDSVWQLAQSDFKTYQELLIKVCISYIPLGLSQLTWKRGQVTDESVIEQAHRYRKPFTLFFSQTTGCN